MSSLGEIIRAKRIANSLEIDDVAHILKMKKKYVIAIEESNLDCFYSHVYYAGFLKQYLKLLKIEDLNLNVDFFTQDQKLEINIPMSDSANPSLLLVMMAIILNIFIYNIFDQALSLDTIIESEMKSESTLD